MNSERRKVDTGRRVEKERRERGGGESTWRWARARRGESKEGERPAVGARAREGDGRAGKEKERWHAQCGY